MKKGIFHGSWSFTWEVDEVIKALLAHGIERVIFINVHHPIGWEYYVNQKFVEDLAR